MGKLDKKIAIIGVGHMGKSLMKGFINSGFKKENIILSDKVEDNKNAVLQSEWIVIAVKPSVAHKVISEIKENIHNKLIISVAAAVSISSMEKITENKNQKIIRIMPNIAVAYNQGVIGLLANENVSETEKKRVIDLFLGLGLVVELKKEKDIDTVTLMSACTPAIIAHFMEMFSRYGVTQGLSSNLSEKIVMQSFKGTIEYIKKSNITFNQLVKSVATKGGVTEEIIRSLDDKKVLIQYAKSLDKGYARINYVRKQLDN